MYLCLDYSSLNTQKQRQGVAQNILKKNNKKNNNKNILVSIWENIGTRSEDHKNISKIPVKSTFILALTR